jgi:hypothetical protein
VYHQPTTFEERRDLAETACDFWEMQLPVLIDTLEPSAGVLYRSWPNRLYLIGTDGKIVYRGPEGPRGVKMREGEKALRKALGLPEGEYVTPEGRRRGGRGSRER